MGLIDVLSSRLVPTDALIFYKSESRKYIEHRSIVNGKMCSGEPLTVKQYINIAKCAEKYAKESKEMGIMHGMVPENMLFVEPNLEKQKIVWWHGPEERMMYFHDELKIPEGKMKVPGMVYMAEKGRLSVFCFKGRKPKVTLYHAPFFNVYDNGNVCLGNSHAEKPKDNTFKDWMMYWEKLFWQSEFVHLIGSNPISENLVLVTKRCIETGEPFPQEMLKKHKKKMKDLLK